MKYNELDLYYQFINNAVQGLDTMKDELETSNIKEKFHQFGYKYTDQHRLILDVLLENPDLHLSSEDICEYFKKRKIDIGRSTVYRTLIVLEKMKIVRKVNLEQHGKTIVFVTHEIDEALLFGDRVILLSDGPTKVDGETHLKKPKDERSLTDCDLVEERNAIIRVMQGYGNPGSE